MLSGLTEDLAPMNSGCYYFSYYGAGRYGVGHCYFGSYGVLRKVVVQFNVYLEITTMELVRCFYRLRKKEKLRNSRNFILYIYIGMYMVGN